MYRNETLTSNISSTVYRGEFLVIPGEQFGWVQKRNQAKFGAFLNQVVEDFRRPDLVHVQSSVNAGIYGFPWLEMANLPYIITEHATFFRRGLLKAWSIPLVQDCFASAHRSMAVSSALRNDLINVGVTTPIEVIPNMYDGNVFCLENHRHEHGSFMFLLVCGLNKKKGVNLAINALSLVQKHLPDIRLVVAGDGPEREVLEQMTASLGLSHSVDFLGLCSRQTVSRLMAECHCLLSTSYFETFGVTLIEGLASGLPVIATQSGGPEDFVKAPFGELVPLGDEAALASAMKRMIENYDFRESAFEERDLYASQNFSGEALHSALLPIYEQAAISGGTPEVRLNHDS